MESENHEYIRRRYVFLSREGFSFLFVMLFIVVGGVVRQVNLLFLIAGLLTAASVINWRFAVTSLRKLRVRRKYPELVEAGQPLIVDVELTNRRSRVASFGINIAEGIRRKVARRKKPLTTSVKSFSSQIGVGDTETISYKCRLYQRGKYHFAPMFVWTKAPLGLLNAFGWVESNDEILVFPPIGKLSARWQKVAYGERRAAGQSSNEHRRDSDGEFYSMRPWQTGDTKRSIHWRTSAKVGELTVRQLEELRDGSIAVVVDLWRPEPASEDQLINVEIALSMLATTIQQTISLGNGKLVVGVAGNKVLQFNDNVSVELRNRILTEICEIRGNANPDTENVLNRTISETIREMNTVVISTRPKPSRIHEGELLGKEFAWVDVSSNEIDEYFSIR